jgi:hypothetical protein
MKNMKKSGVNRNYCVAGWRGIGKLNNHVYLINKGHNSVPETIAGVRFLW